MDKDRIKKLAGIVESKEIEVTSELMDRILEALEAGIYAIENPDSNQKFAVDAMHETLRMIDKVYTYQSRK